MSKRAIRTKDIASHVAWQAKKQGKIAHTSPPPEKTFGELKKEEKDSLLKKMAIQMGFVKEDPQ